MEKNAAHLIREKAPLQPQVGRDVLVDCPSELAVKPPGHEAHQNGAECKDARHSHQTRLQIYPCVRVDVGTQRLDCLINLIHLNARVGHHAQVVEAQPDDLNRVLQSQRIPRQQQLV